MNKQTTTLTANCPDCETVIRFKRAPELGEMISCHACDALLEVVDLEPIILDWAEDYDEDDEDYDEYDEEDDDRW